MRFPDRLIEEIRERNDLVDVIAMYVPLKRVGRHFKARCPFHAERTPSFVVSPEKQVYHCFGCGAGGNVYSFLMQHERMGFADAVRFLAKRAGLSLPREDGGRSEESEAVYAANAYAARCFQRNLKGAQGREARDYLAQRGLSEDVAETFGLGYALPSWDGLIKAALADNHQPRSLERAGLVLAREGKEGFYDRFRHRLMFPIVNLSGKVAGFGGRRLDEKEEPKYLNSPETAIYQKGRLLYGLFQTKGTIRDAGNAVVVEGYLDFLSPYQAGVKNIVATLGTAFTPDQARLVGRFASEAVLFYDNDEAGQKAVRRAFEALLEVDLDIYVATPPPGMDPDRLLREEGREGLERALSEKRDLIDFELDRLAKTYDLASPAGKSRAVKELLELLARFKDEIRQRLYLQKLAGKVGLSEAVLSRSLAKKTGGALPMPTPKARSTREMALEREVLRLLAKQPERMDPVREILGEDPFRDGVVLEVYALLAKGKRTDSADFMSWLGSEESQRMVASWAFQEKEEQEERLFEKCLNELKHLRTKARSHDLLGAIAEAERTKDQAAARSLTSKYQGLLKGGERK